jgi:hypothetical protein
VFGKLVSLDEKAVVFRSGCVKGDEKTIPLRDFRSVEINESCSTQKALPRAHGVVTDCAEPVRVFVIELQNSPLIYAEKIKLDSGTLRVTPYGSTVDFGGTAKALRSIVFDRVCRELIPGGSGIPADFRPVGNTPAGENSHAGSKGGER